MKFAAVVLLVISIAGCKTQKSKPEAGKTWPGQMQSMASDVKRLLPYIYDGKAYTDPKNREKIVGLLSEFAQAAHQVPTKAGEAFIGDDLLIEYSLKNLREDLNRAAFSLQVGLADYSRSVTKGTLNHCFRCHSVTPVGGAAAWDLGEIRNLNLAPIEKADLLVATRKYEEALKYMESLLDSEEFQKTYAFDFESLLRRYLALMIRVENSPGRALRELDQILERSTTPYYIAQQGEGWRKSLRDWSKEKKRTSFRNAKELFNEVEQRFKKARSIQQYEKDHAGDVEYLRATSMLHQNFKLLKQPGEQARAMFLLGKAYEVLDELGSWNLHESYYEACLKKAPKTATAKTCYHRLEASLYSGYSGTSGIHIPAEERERLIRLKEYL